MLAYISILMSGMISFYALAEGPSVFFKRPPLEEPSTIEEALLSIYPAHPFHESIKDPMPDQKCETVGSRKSKSQRCGPIEMKYQDNPDKFNFVLAETEKWMDTSSPYFLSTPLGQEYSNLKKFMKVYNQFTSCSKDKPSEEDGTAQALMARIERNMSNNIAEEPGCRSSEDNNIQMIFNVIRAAHPQSTDRTAQPKECSVSGTLLSDSLRESVFFRVNMESRFNASDFNNPSFDEQLTEELCIGPVEYFVLTTRGNRKKYKPGNICTEQEKSNIGSIIQQAKEQIRQSSAVSSDSNDSLESAQQKINQYVSELNGVLQKYDQKRKELLDEKEQRFSQLSNSRSDQRAKWRVSKEYHQKLDTAKQEVFASYQIALAGLHKHDLGFLMQSPSLQKETGLDQLDKLIPKHFGLSGVQEEVLSHQEDFPVLQPISNQVVQNAIKDVQKHSKKNIQHSVKQREHTQQDNEEYMVRLAQVPYDETKEELDEWYKSRRMDQVEHLIMTSPDVIGPALMDNPEYSEMICQAVKNIEKDEKKYETLKKAMMIGTITGVLAISLIAPFVGVVGIPALLTTAGVALTVTSADIKLRMDKVQKHRALKEEMLSAYLAGVGDDQSIEQIRHEWKQAMTEDIYAKWIGALAVFDITRTGLALKKALPDAAMRTASSTQLVTRVTKSKNIIETVQQNDDQLRALQKLMNTHPESDVQEFFRTIAIYPKKKQIEILEDLPNMAETVALDLQGLTATFKTKGIGANIKFIMGRFVTCATCKVQPSVKIKQITNE